jgi:hypothetical protein
VRNRSWLPRITDENLISSLSAAETEQYFLGLQAAHRVARTEPVGKGQQQNDQRLLVFPIDVEHVVTNTVGLSRVVEQAVASGFFLCSRDGVIRKPL